MLQWRASNYVNLDVMNMTGMKMKELHEAFPYFNNKTYLNVN